MAEPGGVFLPFFDTEESENTIGSGILNVVAAAGWTCLPV